MAARDYYEALGVSRDASSEELQQAFRKLARQCDQGLDLRLRLQRLDLSRALRLLDTLVSRGLGKTDVGGNHIVGSIDRSQGRLHFKRRVNSCNQRSIQHNAITRLGSAALTVHVLVEVTQVFSQIVDGNASPNHESRSTGIFRCFKCGYAFPQH